MREECGKAEKNKSKIVTGLEFKKFEFYTLINGESVIKVF